MRAATLVALAGAALVTANPRIAQVYYQPITVAETTPLPLADITFDPFSPSTAEVSSYEAPDLLTAFETHPAGEEQLVRIGLYDPKKAAWISSVGVASAATFTEKGYSPHISLHVDEAGRVLGAGARGVGIDAGQTRDFGPQAVITVAREGKGVEVGRPVELGVDGRKKVEEAPKSLIQKYWWVIGILVFVMLGSGDK
ncbi:hypothetical protein F5X68DRAFT_231036 [Plectosphaerella plurivora]|uniref:Cyclin-dependent protein kinase regulator pho80 n=1 Tax=Plectosphaerella plurivora TaxID=936078 RepID=A0A9P9ACM7_9PEZI|nr:hypothetical protein F5X68DRAFT_231036 [Plectosphaerella plurivora]